MNAAIYVGIDPKTVTEVSKQIQTILNTKADQATIRMALSVLQKSVVAPTNTTISNCSIEMVHGKR